MRSIVTDTTQHPQEFHMFGQAVHMSGINSVVVPRSMVRVKTCWQQMYFNGLQIEPRL